MIRTATTLVLTGLMMAGCSMTPKSGVEARNQAMARMDQVNATMSRKQAIDALETGQLDKARTHIIAAIDRSPEDSASWSLLGRVLMEQMRLDESVRALERAIELNPNAAESHYFLGVIHERWTKDDLAAEHYMRAFEADPQRPQYLMAAAEMHMAMGDTQCAHAIVKEHLVRFEHHPAMQHLMAHLAMLEGDFDRAAHRCEEARLLAPDDESIARDLCRMRFRAGNWGGCIDAVEEYHLRFDTPDVALDQLRARCLTMVNRQNEARAVYRTLCATDPEDVICWRERGLLAWEQEDWTTMEACAKALTSLRPDMYEATLFSALVARAQGHWVEAASMLESLTQAHEGRPEGWVVLSSLRMRLGDRSGAEKARHIAVKCDSNLTDDPRVTGVFGLDGH